MKQVNYRLKAARTLRGLTQAELARKLGRSQSWLCLLERGFRAPSDLEISLVARVLRVDPSYLFPISEQDSQEIEALNG